MNKILIADDEKKIRETLKDYLGARGFDIVLAADGEEALDLAFVNQFDLILLDVEMPIMSGIQTLEILRSNEEFKKIPVMFLTGSSDTETVAAACSLGASDYVVKPFMPQELLDRVKKILRF